MISRLKRQAKTYYNAQANLAYVDSVFENLANADDPTFLDNDAWMKKAENSQTKMATALEEILKLGGTVKEGCVFNSRGEIIQNHMVWAA